MIEEAIVASDDGSAESFVDGDVWMGTREDLFKFLHAILGCEILDLRGFRLGVNLAKERILLGSAVETAEAHNGILRKVLGDEFTYEFHLDSPKTKIWPANQSIFIQSPTPYP